MIKNINKLVTMVIVLFGMVGCAGTSPNAQAKQTLQTTKEYKVGKVNVTLAEHTFYDFSEEQKHYPNGEELSKYFKEDLEKYFKEAGKFCQSNQECLTLDLDINYQRNFNMGSVSTSAPTYDRTMTIRKENSVIYNNTKKGLKPNKGGIVGNTLNELAVFTKAGEDKANLDHEREYIDVISQVTVREIMELGQ